MHRTCNVADKPIASGPPSSWIERLAPDDPLFDVLEPEIPHRERIRPRRRARALPTAASIVALALQACGGSSRPAQSAGDAVLVQLEADAEPPSFPRANEDGPPIVPLASVGSVDEPPVLRLSLPAGADAAEYAREVAARPGVEFAEPVFVYRTARAPNDSRFKELWGLADIKAPDAWATSTGDRKVTIALVDDGLATTHADLAPNLWVNPSEIAGNGRDDDGDGYVDDVNGYDFVLDRGDPSPAGRGEARWHGSHVAGTVGAAGDNRIGVAGVNWKVSLMALRAIGPSGGRSDDMARAIDYAVDHGARVINASWGGGGQSRVISRAIARAGRHDVLFVAAAGNDSASRPAFPASLDFDNVISVGATTPDEVLASFSNRGAMLGAPGVGILSTTAPGQYGRYDGTSMAAPHVTGAAALLWAARPAATLGQVRNALLESAASLAGTKNGRLDAGKAMADLLRGAGDGGSGPFALSRGSLLFTAPRGRTPRAQTISVRAEGGGARRWVARPDSKWARLSSDRGETPSRLTVHVDPNAAGPGEHEARVRIEEPDRRSRFVELEVRLHVGDAAAIAANGAGCSMRDGSLHVDRGATCMLSLAGLGTGASASVQWRLPGGALVQGGRMYGQFIRRGEYQVEATASEEGVEAISIVVE